jgi:hypothetical protein
MTFLHHGSRFFAPRTWIAMLPAAVVLSISSLNRLADRVLHLGREETSAGENSEDRATKWLGFAFKTDQKSELT